MSEWIPVNSKLPDEEGYYLVYDGKYINTASYCPRLRFMIEKYKCNDGECSWVTDDCVCLKTNVTHWMPLPTPPKE